MQNYRRCVVEAMWMCGALELSIRFALNSLLVVFELIMNGHQELQPLIQITSLLDFNHECIISLERS